MTQADVLEYLQEHREVKTKEIEEDLDYAPGSVYRKLQALSKAGWVEITKADDRVSNIYIITEKGDKIDPESIRPKTY